MQILKICGVCLLEVLALAWVWLVINFSAKEDRDVVVCCHFFSQCSVLWPSGLQGPLRPVSLIIKTEQPPASITSDHGCWVSTWCPCDLLSRIGREHPCDCRACGTCGNQGSSSFTRPKSPQDYSTVRARELSGQPNRNADGESLLMLMCDLFALVFMVWLCSGWQDFSWCRALHGLSGTAEPFVHDSRELQSSKMLLLLYLLLQTYLLFSPNAIPLFPYAKPQKF